MAVSMNIPLPGQPGEALLRGLEGSASSIQKMMQPRLAQQQMDQQQRQFQQQMDFKRHQYENPREMSALEQLMMQAKIQKAQADAQHANALSGLYNQVLGIPGNTAAPMPMMGGPEMTPPPAVGLPGAPGQMQEQMPGQMPMPQPELQPLPQEGAVQSQFAETIINPGDPSKYMVDKLVGVLPAAGRVETSIQDGKMIKSYPSGKITMTDIGPSQQESARKEIVLPYIKKAYEKSMDALSNVDNNERNLQYISNTLESYGDGSDVIGPINKHLANIFGSPESKDVLGQILAATGNIVLDAAKDIKGAFTGRDQALINSMKPNATDPYYVFLGKLKGMSQLNDLTKRRLELYSDNLETGISPNAARKKAIKETDFDKLAPTITSFVDFSVKREALKEGRRVTGFKNKEEFADFFRQLTPSEQIKMQAMAGVK